jgi:hypothetical protein
MHVAPPGGTRYIARVLPRATYTLALTAVIAACSADPPAPPADPGAVFLSPTEHLLRASMALRGMRPSLDELRAVDADPTALPAIVDRYLDSPRFGATIRDLHNDALHLRQQQWFYTMGASAPLEDRSFTEMAESVSSEPLRLIEDIVMRDRPYTEIVTADYTMADEIVAAVWGMQRAPAGDQWVRTVYPDDRGAAGILATSALHGRYLSTGINSNRGRAAVIATALLCHDFADSEIEIDAGVDLFDSAAVANAVQNNPSCVGCHQTLDPLAAYFWRFQQGEYCFENSKYPTPMYYPNDGDKWLERGLRPPSFFGVAAQGLTGLGVAIAADPRFARCATQRFASYLLERPMKTLDPGWIATLQRGFVDGGYRAKRLARAIVLSDEFRTGGHLDPARGEDIVGYQKVRPQQYSQLLEDLTGHRWRGNVTAPYLAWWKRYGEFDYLDDDIAGYRVLMGGIDSYYTLDPVHTMTPTAALVAREAAVRAAVHVVHHDSAAASRRLFVAAEPGRTDDAALRANLAHMHARIFGVLHDADVEPELALWRSVYASSGDAHRAWIFTLTAMLSDLRTVYY